MDHSPVNCEKEMVNVFYKTKKLAGKKNYLFFVFIVSEPIEGKNGPNGKRSIKIKEPE